MKNSNLNYNSYAGFYSCSLYVLKVFVDKELYILTYEYIHRYIDEALHAYLNRLLVVLSPIHLYCA